MSKALLNKINDYQKTFNEKSIYQKVLIILAFFVIIITSYLLMMPAITVSENLICTIEEHNHNEYCYSNTTNEDAIELINLINSIPTIGEFNTNLNSLKNEEKQEELNIYYNEIITKVNQAYNNYLSLDETIQKEVKNIDKILIYSNYGLIENSVANYTISLEKDITIPVYQLNGFDKTSNTILVYNENQDATIQTLLNSENVDFTYWSLILIEKQNQNYVVTEVIKDYQEKQDKIVPKDSYVVLVSSDADKSSTIEPGLYVTVNLNKARTVSNTSELGTVTFSSITPRAVSGLSTIQGADTSELIEINLYNYGTNINTLYSNNKKYPGFQQDGGTKSISALTSKYGYNFGNNITEDLGTLISNVTSNAPGAINKTENGANNPISGAMSPTLGSDGYPALSDNTSLSYLFQSGTYAIKQNTNSINGLFLYNATTGSYSYNCRENHAQFNPGNDTFTLYEQIITPNFIMYPFGNFLPLNNIETQTTQASLINKAHFKTVADRALNKYNNGYGDAYQTLSKALNQLNTLMTNKYGNSWNAGNVATEYFSTAGLNKEIPNDSLSNMYSIDFDIPTNFFFGLEMKMNFMQPKNGKTGIDGNQDMVFYFTGDDDVWVYIDDILFLDLSGIHRHVGGEIDFVNGIVTYYGFDPATGDSTNLIKTVTFEEILGSNENLNSNGTFKDYTYHTFNFYYMERGAGSGVMRMNFNLPLIKKNSIAVTKELTIDDNSETLGNPDFSFQVLKPNSTPETNDDELFITEGTTYDLYNSYGIQINTTPLTVGKNGIFTLKAGERALFSGISEDQGTYYVRELLDQKWVEQYKQVSIDGTTSTTNSYTSVEIDGDSFAGFESTVKDISNGNTTFNFKNNVETNKFGTLKINKNLVSEEPTDKKFDFYVTFDGTPLAVGTKYKINDTTYTVETTGIIKVSNNEQAIIENIIAGSKFTVEEKLSITSGYKTTYSGSEGITITDSNASGTILHNSEVSVTVTNEEKEGFVEIPVNKMITNPNKEHSTYQFNLIEIKENEEIVIDTLEITVDENGLGTGKFNIKYLQPNYTEATTIHNYKITEIVNENDLYTAYDKNEYFVEVTITNKETENFKAEITQVKKESEIVSEVLFKNTILSSLSIKKIVESNGTGNDGTFLFKLFVENSNNKTFNTNIGSITFDENGFVTFELSHSQELIIYGLSYNSKYSIKELTTDGYVVNYRIDNNDRIENSEIIDQYLHTNNNQIEFINMKGYELPETGSSGTLILIIIGTMFLLVPVIYIGYLYKKRSIA